MVLNAALSLPPAFIPWKTAKGFSANILITVLVLADGVYRELGVFTGNDQIKSAVISGWQMTAGQILEAGR